MRPTGRRLQFMANRPIQNHRGSSARRFGETTMDWVVGRAVVEDDSACSQKTSRVCVLEMSGETFEIVGEVELPNHPSGMRMTFTHDSRYMYAIVNCARPSGAELYEMDTRTPSRIARSLGLPDGKFEGIAVHCASSRIFLSDSANRTIWVVNRNHFSVQWRISLDAPGTMAMSPKGDVLYVLSADGDRVWVIDPSTNCVLGQVNGLQKGLSDGAGLQDGSRMFVSHGRRDGESCVVRVRPRSAVQAQVVFAVDSKGNCRISRPAPVLRLVA